MSQLREVNTRKKREQRNRRSAERVLVDGRLVHPNARHGHRGSYTNFMCRCEPCTSAWRKATSRRRAERYAMRELVGGWWVSTGPVEHGMASTYHNWGCQCGPCRFAAARSRNPGSVPRRAVSA